MNGESEIDTKQVNSFLKEGEGWFKKHQLPLFFPAFIAQIPDAINKFSDSVSAHAKSNDTLSSSIKSATWVGVSVAFLALVWDILKTLCIEN